MRRQPCSLTTKKVFNFVSRAINLPFAMVNPSGTIANIPAAQANAEVPVPNPVLRESCLWPIIKPSADTKYQNKKEVHNMANTKLKVNYGTEDNPDGSKTFSNINPEATNENLVSTANKFVSMQEKQVLSVERIDTTTISG